MARTITIFGVIDSIMGKDVVGHLYDLNVEDNTAPIHVLINSYGGELSVGFAMYDIFKASQAPVYTYNLCSAFSSGLIVYLAGEKRYATRNCAFLAHPPKIPTMEEYNLPDDLQSGGTFGKQRQKVFAEILAGETDITKRTANSLVSKDSYFYLDQAINYGMVDGVITKFPTDRMLKDSPPEVIQPSPEAE